MKIQKRESWIMLFVILSGPVFLMTGCQKTVRTCSREGEQPNQFWAKYNLPKVEGAVLCHDSIRDGGKHEIDFTHYLPEGNAGQKKIQEIVKQYEEGFKNTNHPVSWDDREKDKGLYGFVFIKGGEHLSLRIQDCYSGQLGDSIYSKTHRPCLSVGISEEPPLY